MYWLVYLAFGLDGHEPLAAPVARYRYVGRLPLDPPAFAIAHPAELGEKDAIVPLLNPKLFRIGVAETLPGAVLFLELRRLYDLV